MDNPLLKESDIPNLNRMKRLVDYAPILSTQLGYLGAGWEHIWDEFWGLRNGLGELFDNLEYYDPNETHQDNIRACWNAVMERTSRLGISLQDIDCWGISNTSRTVSKGVEKLVGLRVECLEEDPLGKVWLVFDDASKIRVDMN